MLSKNNNKVSISHLINSYNINILYELMNKYYMKYIFKF